MADRLDDLICAFDTGFDSTTSNLEAVGIVLVGWLVIGLVVYSLIKALFKFNQSTEQKKLDQREKLVENGTTESSDVSDGQPAKTCLQVPIIVQERPVSAPNTPLMNGFSRVNGLDQEHKKEGMSVLALEYVS